MNSQRPVITYENIYLLKGKPNAHLLENNSGAAITAVGHVQSINFSVENQRTNQGALGTRGFADRSIRLAPDVQFSVDTIETFNTFSLWSGFISGDYNLDQNFYAIVGNKRGVGFAEDSNESMSGRDVITFGNCFLNNVSISQSTNGLVTSKYSFIASNLEAQKITESDLAGFGGNSFTGKAPSINLTGDQSQDIKFQVTDAQTYYTSVTGDFLPANNTNITIVSDNGTTGSFLIKPDALQSFNLSLPIQRKSIYSLGKKYPIKRKPIFPNLGNVTFNTLPSDFESGNANKNLKDFLNSDEDFTLKFSFNGRSAKNPNFQINNAKLRSNSYVSTVQSAMSYEFAFEFDTSDLVGAIETTQGALFNFTAQAGSVVSLTLGVQNSTVTVDWGDGSSDDYAVGTNVKSHAY